MSLITISIVLYNPDPQLISNLVNPFKNNDDLFFIITDHSSNRFHHIDIFDNINFEYIHDRSNPGFGAGHNNAFKLFKGRSSYFVVCNPDIVFDVNSLKSMIHYMDTNNDVGLLMPLIVYPDGRNQKLAKLLPSPLDLILRRLPFIRDFQKEYVLNDFSYNVPLDVPFLSGCFMLFKSNVYEKIGGFDENFFMYFEDVDICRKVRAEGFRTMIFPNVSIIHDHEFKSLFKGSTFKYFFKSSFFYFNKWGWIYDKQRKIDNDLTLSLISKLNE